MRRTFDAIVIGAGQAGPFLAAKFARKGMTVALVEREHLGGTCVNDGCIPTKTLVASARVAHVVRQAASFGVLTSGETKARQVLAARAHDMRQGWLDARRQLRAHRRVVSEQEAQLGEPAPSLLSGITHTHTHIHSTTWPACEGSSVHKPA